MNGLPNLVHLSTNVSGMTKVALAMTTGGGTVAQTIGIRGNRGKKKKQTIGIGAIGIGTIGANNLQWRGKVEGRRRRKRFDKAN